MLQCEKYWRLYLIKQVNYPKVMIRYKKTKQNNILYIFQIDMVLVLALVPLWSLRPMDLFLRTSPVQNSKRITEVPLLCWWRRMLLNAPRQVKAKTSGKMVDHFSNVWAFFLLIQIFIFVQQSSMDQLLMMKIPRERFQIRQLACKNICNIVSFLQM